MSDPLLELASLIEQRSGFVIPDRGHNSLAEYARKRLEVLSLPGIDEYVRRLRDEGDSQEWRQLLSSITVKESFLFRGRAQFDALEHTILPQFAQKCRERRLRVWCAGCARGEEAATLAIVLAESEALEGWDWTILATDVDETALVDARQGRFGGRSMDAVSADRRDLHFLRKEGMFQLAPDLLSRIHFLRLNMAQPSLRPPGAPFHLVFLRNVLIYFRPDLQRRVIASVENALDPNGWLFLGPSESLLPLDVSLKARDLGDAFCYGWPSEPDPVMHPRPVRPSRTPPTGPTAPVGDGKDGASEEPVLSERIVPVLAALVGGDGTRALRLSELLRREYPDESVIRVLEGSARTLLEDSEGAILAFRAALYLSPDLFEARFLLARVFASLGRKGRARKEYRGVLAVLESSNRETGAVYSRIEVPARTLLQELCWRGLNENET